LWGKIGKKEREGGVDTPGKLEKTRKKGNLSRSGYRWKFWGGAILNKPGKVETLRRRSGIPKQNQLQSNTYTKA